jgi:hypothetical protein
VEAFVDLSNNEKLILTLASVLYDVLPLCIPHAAVLCVGIFVIVRRRRQHPRVPRLALLGLGGLLVAPVVFFLIGVFSAHYLRMIGKRELDLSSWQLQVLLFGGFVEQVVKGGALALLIMAVLIDRSPAPAGPSR